jgi:glucokinase
VTEPLAVAVDLGGTKILSALIDSHGEVVAQTSIPTAAHEGPDAVLGRIDALIAAHLKGPEGTRVGAIGLCSPGPLDVAKGLVLTPPNLPGWVEVPLRTHVHERYELPTVLEKDVNAAAFAEFRARADRGYRDVIYLTVGTGIGQAAFVDGELVRGMGLAGEGGHIVILAEGPQCSCGARGCLEVLASGRAIERAARTAAAMREAEPTRLTARDVLAAALDGDRTSVEIIEKAGRHLGIGIAALVNIFSPQLVVVGGGLTALGELYLQPARDALYESSYVHRLRPAQLEIGMFPTDAGIRGAALLAFQALGAAAPAKASAVSGE